MTTKPQTPGEGYENEAAMVRAITAAAREYGWTYHHTQRSDYGRQIGMRGFPDLILIRGTTIIALEVKHDRGIVTPEQRTWIDAFHAAGAFAAVVWPINMGTIISLLATYGL